MKLSDLHPRRLAELQTAVTGLHPGTETREELRARNAGAWSTCPQVEDMLEDDVDTEIIEGEEAPFGERDGAIILKFA